MKNIFSKSLALFLVFVLCCNLVVVSFSVPMVVYAGVDENGVWDGTDTITLDSLKARSEDDGFLSFVAKSVFYCGTTAGLLCSANVLGVIGAGVTTKEFIDYLSGKGLSGDTVLVQKNGDDITYTNDFVNSVKSWLDNIVSLGDGSVIFTSTYFQDYLTSRYKDICSVMQDNSDFTIWNTSFSFNMNCLLNRMSDYGLGGVAYTLSSSYEGYYYNRLSFAYDADLYLVSEDFKTFYLYDSDCNGVLFDSSNLSSYCEFYFKTNYSQSYFADFSSDNSSISQLYNPYTYGLKTSYSTWYYYLSDGTYRVFVSKVALQEYLGVDKTARSVYLTSNYYNYNTTNNNSMTVNNNTLNNTDWKKVNNNYYNSVVNNISNDMSDDDITEIVDKIMSDFKDIIDDSTGDITDVITDTSTTEVKVLKQIKNQLVSLTNTVQTGFDNIVNSLSSFTSSGSGTNVSVKVSVLQEAIDLMLSDIYSRENVDSDLALKFVISALVSVKSSLRDIDSDYVEIDLGSWLEILRCLYSDEGSDQSVAIDTTALVTLLQSIDENVSSIVSNQVDAKVLIEFLTSVKSSIDDQGTYLEKINDTLLDIKHLQQLGLIENIVSDLLDGLTDVIDIDSASTYLSKVVTSLSTVTDTMQTKFPFSFPWDLQLALNLLAAEPEVPEWDFEINVERFGIHEELHISMEKFEKLSKFSRSMFTLIFLVMICWVALKLYQIYKDDSD